ncbi:hypothetical protein HMI54_013838 [Coelomomyces lativittatus]|nr:hypothetical protein HMI56_000391 [Coelomomyces lativittatus]KAJ1514616.1 hypothetical protein HMI54_013838 [Coelomomyces lativittatus]KAJ1517288.1 hypothetical protein HMI55_000151 [Coelomomyces lativittatus]
MYPKPNYFNSNSTVPTDLGSSEYEYYASDRFSNQPEPGWKGGNLLTSQDMVSSNGHSDFMYVEGHGGGPPGSHSYLPLHKFFNNTSPNIASEYEPSFRTPETYGSMHSPLLSKEETYEYPHPVSSFFSETWNPSLLSSSVSAEGMEPGSNNVSCQVAGMHGGVYKEAPDMNMFYGQPPLPPSVPRSHMEMAKYIPTSTTPNGQALTNQTPNLMYPPYAWRTYQPSPVYLQLVNQPNSSNNFNSSYPCYSLYPPYPNPVVGYNMMNVHSNVPSGQSFVPPSFSLPNSSSSSSTSSTSASSSSSSTPSVSSSSSSSSSASSVSATSFSSPSSNMSSSFPSSASSSTTSTSIIPSSHDYIPTSPIPMAKFSGGIPLGHSISMVSPYHSHGPDHLSIASSSPPSLGSGAVTCVKPMRRKRKTNELKKSLEEDPLLSHVTATNRPKKRKSSKIPLFIPNLGPVSDYATANKCGDGVNFTCKTCAKTFNQIYNLKSHLRTHSNERPYQCPICQKPFLRKADMLRHTKIHNRPNRHKCLKCNIFFPNLPSYKMHVESSRTCRESFDSPEWVSYDT